MPNLAEILIYGAGGHAREVAWLAQNCTSEANPIAVKCFIYDYAIPPGKCILGIPVLSLEEASARHPHAQVVVAIGDPEARACVAQRAASAGFTFATLIHPRVEKSEWVDIGEGTVICAGSIITTNIRIGRHVHLNLGCTISHDAVLGDFTTLAPGVHVCGWVHIGARVYVGAGAVIINGAPDSPLQIGDGAVIGAGACVTKSVEPSITVVGVPAKPLLRSQPS